MFTINSELPTLTNNHERLRVDSIVQEAVLKIDEIGTVAAAATNVAFVTLSIKDTPEELVVNVNQPFLSIIVDKRNQIPLFVSKIFDP